MPDNSRMNLHCTVPNCKLNGKAKHYHNVDPTAITDGKSWGPLLEARLAEVSPALSSQIKTDAINVPELVSAILEHFGYVSAKANQADKEVGLPKMSRTCNYEDCERRYVDHEHVTKHITSSGLDLTGLEDPEDRGDFGFPGIGWRGGLYIPADGSPMVMGPANMIRLPEEESRAMVNLTVPEDASYELNQILTVHLPRWYDLFVEKNSGYQNGRGTAFELGIKGQYSDMHRKFMKLKRAMWDDKPLVGEQLDEILLDLIGHIMLTLVMTSEDKVPDDAGETFQPTNPDWQDPAGRQPGDA